MSTITLQIGRLEISVKTISSTYLTLDVWTVGCIWQGLAIVVKFQCA